MDFIKRKLLKLVESIDEISSRTSLRFKFIGPEVDDLFLLSPESDFFIEEFENNSVHDAASADVLVIVGSINRKLEDKIQKEYAKIQSVRKMLVHIPGSLNPEQIKRSDVKINQFSPSLNFDFVYEKFPIDLKEFTAKVTKLEFHGDK